MASPRGVVAPALPPAPQGSRSSPRARRFSMESGAQFNRGHNSGRRYSFASGVSAVSTVAPEDERLLRSLRRTPERRHSPSPIPTPAPTTVAGRSSEGRARARHGGNGSETALTRAQAALRADAALPASSPREVRSARPASDVPPHGRSLWAKAASAGRQRAPADLSIGARETTHSQLSEAVAAYQAAEQARRQAANLTAAAAARRSSIRWGGGPPPNIAAKQGEAVKQGEATAGNATRCETGQATTMRAKSKSVHAKLSAQPHVPLCVRCKRDLVRVCVCPFL